MLIANNADTEPGSAQEMVHMQSEVAGAAQDMVHAELELAQCPTQCNQPASSSEVIVDSESVYSVCCSDVTNDTDTPDIVHVDCEAPVVTDHGTTCHFFPLSLALLYDWHHYIGCCKKHSVNRWGAKYFVTWCCITFMMCGRICLSFCYIYFRATWWKNLWKSVIV